MMLVSVKRALLTGIACLLTFVAQATQLDDIRKMLEQAPVQEKVYLHTDNTCYFKGDTLWYKAYVVRADDLTYTDMSRLLYVELVSPDGMLVERQTVAVAPDGEGCGNFLLPDSVYSGFYELRAYTRWMLNFCVTEREYEYTDRALFFNDQMMHDFYRQFGAVYSRVIPVYERSETEGDYSQKYIVSRPKTRLDKELNEELKVSFYPEGGHLVAGTRCVVAFEATNEEGEQVDVSGRVGNVAVKTEHQGRGTFTVQVPDDGRLKAEFTYKGKGYQFDLPKTERMGCALHLTDEGWEVKASVSMKLLLPECDYAVAVLCRGVLKVFVPLKPDAQGRAEVRIDKLELPTGVNDLVVIDSEGRPLADRLFFVNHHDYDQQHIVVTTPQTDYQPFELVTVNVEAPAEAETISISVRDGATDEPTYDNGNIMTDLLLSSELKGFIAYPAYYFEADDQQHRRHLDLLMMVQGWRRYDYLSMVNGEPLRYEPEKGLTVEGGVYPFIPPEEFEEDEVKFWSKGIFGYSERKEAMLDHETQAYKHLKERISGIEVQNVMNEAMEGRHLSLDEIEGSIWVKDVVEQRPATSIGGTHYGQRLGGLKYEVTLDAELVELNAVEEDEEDIEVYQVNMQTDHGGHFQFKLPTFYGKGILFMKASKSGVGKKQGKRLKWAMDEEAYPDFYVKRDLAHPVFAKKYSYYQCHLPEESNDFIDGGGPVDSGERLSSMDRQLREVQVSKRRRRGRAATDYTKPACVYDAFELYNLVTDYGLSRGMFYMPDYPLCVTTALLGNYNRNRQFNIQARISSGNLTTPYVFFRNFKIDYTTNPFISDRVLNDNIKLARQNEVRLFSDVELRNEDKQIEMNTGTADVTLDFVLMEENAKRYVYRDRRIVVQGLFEPDEFYQPDYSRRPLPADLHDYRRTLYWDPEATLDDNGRLTLTFYNNSKPTRIRVSAAGLTTAGKPLYTVEGK